MKRVVFGVVWRSCCMAAIALAVNAASAGEPLALQEAMQMALDGHPLLQQRRMLVGAAEDDRKGALWQRYPNLTLEASSQVGRSPGTTDQQGTTLRVDQPLWTFGRITANIDGATLRRLAAEVAVEEVEQELLGRVVQAFGDVRRLQARLAIAKDSLADQERLYALIQRRVAQEVSPEVDLALAGARLNQARTDVLAVTSALFSSRSTLAQLTGEPSERPLLAPAWPVQPVLDLIANLEAAQGFSPALRRLAIESRLAENEAEGRRAAQYPSLVARYERYGGVAAASNFDRVMVVLNFQSGPGLSASAATSAAAKRGEAARDALSAGVREVIERTTQQFTEAAAFVEQAAPTKRYAEATRDVSDSYLRQYTAGRKSWFELMNAQRELAQARYTASDAELGAQTSALKLEILTGRLTGRLVRAAIAAPVESSRTQ